MIITTEIDPNKKGHDHPITNALENWRIGSIDLWSLGPPKKTSSYYVQFIEELIQQIKNG